MIVIRQFALTAVLTCGLSVASLATAGSAFAQESKHADPIAAPARMADAPVAAFQSQLLEVAMSAASAMPAVPHVKTRCQLQQDVVMALLAIDHPVRAAKCAEEIVNWRRGVAFAAIAQHCAVRGLRADAEDLVVKARAVLDSPEVKQEQEWRQDAIRSAVAAALQSMGQKGAAAEFAKRVVDPENGKVESLPLLPMSKAEIEAHFRSVDAAIEASNMDALVVALGICAQLFDREFADAAIRTGCEDKIRAARKRMPLPISMDLLTKLASSASKHQDRAKAVALLHEAQELMTSARWVAEDEVKTGARLAKALAAAGDREGAVKQARAAFAVYETSQKLIVDIWRAGCLRELAEAWFGIGDTEKAGLFYGKALAEGVVNPNSRPRAQDLIATCISMVATGFTPDAAMQERIQSIGKGLGQPW